LASSDEIDAPEVPELADDGAHLDTFRAADMDDDAPAADDVVDLDDEGQPIAGPVGVEQISKEAFWIVFEQSFALPGMFVPIWKPLAVQPDEKDAARSASDAVYELLEIYFPSALMPQSDTLARLLACVPFLLAKIMVVRAIMADRRKPPSGAPSGGEFRSRRAQANTNAPPEAGSPLDWMDREAVAA